LEASVEDDEGYVVGDVNVVAATDAAICVTEVGGDPFGEWYPRSQIHPSSDVGEDAEVGDRGELIIATWLAEERGLC
jgi:hypothetical protein